VKPKPRRVPPGEDRLLAHIDGGARGNPGPAGYGVHIQRRDAEPGAEPIAELYGFLGVATNNIAEYSALLALLEHVLPMRPAALLVRSDSELLIKQMKGEYRVKDPRLQVLHQAARRMAATLPEVTYEHVPRERNREADALANQAMDSRSASGPLPAALNALPAAAIQRDLTSL
jgi:ribonuclease HI